MLFFTILGRRPTIGSFGYRLTPRGVNKTFFPPVGAANSPFIFRSTPVALGSSINALTSWPQQLNSRVRVSPASGELFFQNNFIFKHTSIVFG